MTVKIIGAILIIAGCGGFGFMIAASHHREVVILENFLTSLSFIESEIQYNMTPLPELCKAVALRQNGVLKSLFNRLAAELDKHISANVKSCMEQAIEATDNIPTSAAQLLSDLGKNLGVYDVEGQISGLQTVKHSCVRALDALRNNQDVRVRSYKTLGLCAGAALVILFI